VPIDGEPAVNHQIFLDYSDWLLGTEFPKLMIVAEPGAILVGESLTHARKFKNQTEVTVPGWHFVQEQSPDEIGEALQQWLANLPANGSS
jgi:haloalkane dehalogenase